MADVTEAGGARRDIVARIEARVLLPPETRSAGVARRFVAAALETWGCTELADTVLLLVSEVVTNAILYARSESELVLRFSGGVLRVEVADESAQMPTKKRYADDAATGRGLVLVENLADSWGTEAADGGKTVWFEIAVGDGTLARTAAG